MSIRRTAAALTSAAALSVTGVALTATPAAAAGPVFTGGLINVGVNVTDIEVLRNSLNNNQVRILNNVLNDNEVNLAVAATVIAQVCNTQVGVVATLVQTGEASCDVPGGTIDFTQAT